MLARARGASDEHRLRDEKAIWFQHCVCSFLPRRLGGWLVVGRKKRLKMESGCQVGLERPAGCCLGRIGSGGG